MTEIERLASERQISASTLDRAKKKLGVEAEKIDFDRGWQWSLPEQTPAA